MAAGSLREKVKCQKRAIVDDGYGNEVSGDFADQFTVSARIKPLRGGESVISQRLQGVHVAVVTVRSSSYTRQITTAWRLINARDTSKVYNIRDVSPDERGAYIDLLCELGPAT